MQGTMDYDGFLKSVGGFGKYQKKIYFVLSVINLLGAFTNMDFVLITAIPKHWCKSPVAGLENLTIDHRKELTIPRDADGEYSKCMMYNTTQWEMSAALDYRISNMTTPLVSNASSQVPCTSWEFDKTEYKRTIVSQWSLVCGQEVFSATAIACFAFGKLAGSMITGQLSDRFGRRPVFLIFTALNCAVGVASGFAPEPITFCVACFIKGFVNLASFLPAYILTLEMVGSSWRVAAGSIMNLYWAAGYFIVAGVSYYTKDWFVMETSLHASFFVFVIIFIWLIPESPRWLLRKGRVDEAMEIMKAIAKENGVGWDKAFEKVQASDPKEKGVSFTKLRKSHTMVLITIISCFMWFSVNLMFFGLSYNSPNLVGDVYLNFFIAGAVEIPAYGIQWFLLQKMGRRRSVIGSYCLAAAALLVTLPIPKDYAVVTTVFAMIGKFGITLAYGMVYIYTPELYPTEYRTTGLGFSSMCGRLGSILAPYLALLGNVTAMEIPLAIFGVVAGIAGISGIFLPETKNVPLPETLDDVQKFQDNMLSCSKKRHQPSHLREKITAGNVPACDVVELEILKVEQERGMPTTNLGSDATETQDSMERQPFISDRGTIVNT